MRSERPTLELPGEFGAWAADRLSSGTYRPTETGNSSIKHQAGGPIRKQVSRAAVALVMNGRADYHRPGAARANLGSLDAGR